MARMLNLRNVLELVNDGLHNRTFAQQEFIHQRHEHIFHVGTNTCDKLDVEGAQQFFKQLFGNVAFIGKQFTEEFSDHLGNRLAIIHIARCQHEIEQFASVIENQVQFEAKKPASRGLATLVFDVELVDVK